jgi:hypothetical protein
LLKINVPALIVKHGQIARAVPILFQTEPLAGFDGDDSTSPGESAIPGVSSFIAAAIVVYWDD